MGDNVRAGAEHDASDEAIKKAMAGELSEEQLNLIKDLDKESSVRKLATPWIAKMFYLACIAVTLYHFITSLVGLVFLTVLGPHWWSLALSVGTAIALMMLTRTVHPPAGSNPVIVFLSQPTWSFLLFPTLLGAVVLVAVALIYNNATRDAKYPKYW